MKLLDILKTETAQIIMDSFLVLGPIASIEVCGVYEYVTASKIRDDTAEIVFYDSENYFVKHSDFFVHSIDKNKDGILDETKRFIHGNRCITHIPRYTPSKYDQDVYSRLLDR